MNRNLLLLLLAMFSFSCFDKDDSPAMLPQGTYVGEFERTGSEYNNGTAQVTLTFKDQWFTGSSEQMRFPAIGPGTYQVKGQQIEFKAASFFTADFDWTLILDGTFTLSTPTKETLIFTKKTGSITDVYRLTRQVPE